MVCLRRLARFCTGLLHIWEVWQTQFDLSSLASWVTGCYNTMQCMLDIQEKHDDFGTSAERRRSPGGGGGGGGRQRERHINFIRVYVWLYVGYVDIWELIRTKCTFTVCLYWCYNLTNTEHWNNLSVQEISNLGIRIYAVRWARAASV